jgi:hypothetical protein
VRWAAGSPVMAWNAVVCCGRGCYLVQLCGTVMFGTLLAPMEERDGDVCGSEPGTAAMESMVRVLIATADGAVKERCRTALKSSGCVVEYSAGGFAMLGLLRRGRYDVVAMDDSLEDMGLVELLLNIEEIAANDPTIVTGGHELWRFRRVFDRCNVTLSGPPEEVPEMVATAVRDMHGAGP